MEKNRWIIPLASIDEGNAAQIGGKGAGLNRLRKAGFPMPDGFCVSIEGYRTHVAEIVAANIAKLADAPAAQRADVLSEARSQVLHTSLSADLVAAIKGAYSSLGARSVAVRSSASAEDLPDHSFAGQYETFLSVTSLEHCLEAVQKCWASLWTDRAYEYRCHNSIDHEQVMMAVIVQKQVAADSAGVAFTLDPVTGSPSRIVIESCAGLGDALVSGRVQPDRIVLRKKNLELLWQTKVSEEAETSLDLRTARKLARRVRKLEKRLGCPQDVEWALEDGRLWFLQTRPITAVPPAKPWEDRQVWTNFNLGEVVPDVMTPATWSMIETILFPMFDGLGRLIGVDGRKHPPAGRVVGRLYWHVNAGLAAAQPFVSMSTLNKTNSMFGGDQLRMYELGELDIPDEALPDVGFRWPRYILSWPRILYDLFIHRASQADKLLTRLRSRRDELDRLDIGAAPTDELADTVVKGLRDNLADCDLLYLLSGALPIGVFQRACQNWLGENDSTTTAYRLLAAQGGISDTEAGLDLWRLAVLAHEDPETEEVLNTASNWEEARPKAGKRFLAAWDEFMAEHGHHCRGELEFANARWAETPDYVLDLVRSYLRSIDRVDPLARHEKLAQEQAELAEQCRRKLRNPIKRWLFNWSVRGTRKAARNRENWKDAFVRLVAFYRRVLLELGERLHEEGILVESSDILFLKLTEIAPVARGCAEFDVKQQIEARRAEYEKDCSVTPPPVIIGRFDPDKHVVPEVDTDVETLKGIAVSSGVVTGRARVILRTDDDQHIESGEILVAPFTDPAWTPYFLPAAGVVMDMGGVLSHGAVIAREYGLPAVVNVGPASRIIQTGQTIRVDGDSGTVTILDKP